MSKITTIEDKDGNVWTGKEVARDNHAISNAIMGPLTGGLMQIDSDTVTVETNGERHTGDERK